MASTGPSIYGPNGKQVRRPVNLRKNSTAQHLAQLAAEDSREDDERAVIINYGRVELNEWDARADGPLARV